jgi:hypothetical protein
VRRVCVVIFIDALGNEVVRTHDFLKHAPGRHRRLDTVIGYSSSANPSLLTGRRPDEHGHFSVYRRDQGDGVFRRYRLLMWLAHHTKGRGKLRQFLRRHLERHVRGYYELYDIPLDQLAAFDLVQREDIFLPGGVPPHETWIDHVHASGLPYRVWSWRVPEVTSRREVLADLREQRSQFLLFYSARLDALMHQRGVDHPDVGALLGEYETWIDDIRNAVGDAELHIHVFSDHGMTDVREGHDVHAALSATGLRVPGDYRVFTDSTMARFWFDTSDGERTIRAALPDREWGRWLTDADLATYGIEFERREYGDAIYLLAPGHVIVPSFMGTTACAGMHGYAPEDPTCDAWLYSSPEGAVDASSILDLPSIMTAEVKWLTGSDPGNGS